MMTDTLNIEIWVENEALQQECVFAVLFVLLTLVEVAVNLSWNILLIKAGW